MATPNPQEQLVTLLTKVFEDVQKRTLTGRPSEPTPEAKTAADVFNLISDALRVPPNR